MEEIITKAKSRFSEINGIIHCAGVTRDSFILKKTREEMEAVLAAKVYGTVYLDEVSKEEELDFFVLFSSAAAVMGNVGQCDYAYANSFMDSFAEMREGLRAEGKRCGKTLSINWPLWQEGGMGLDEQTKAWMKEVMAIVPLSTENGMKAFEDVFKLDSAQVMVIEGEEEKIKDVLRINYAGDSIESGKKLENVTYELTEEEKGQVEEKIEAYLE